MPTIHLAIPLGMLNPPARASASLEIHRYARYQGKSMQFTVDLQKRFSSKMPYTMRSHCQVGTPDCYPKDCWLSQGRFAIGPVRGHGIEYKCRALAHMQVPSACDLGRVVPQLAYLKNFAGCVELPLRKANLLDPNNLAALPGPEGRSGREVCSAKPCQNQEDLCSTLVWLIQSLERKIISCSKLCHSPISLCQSPR